MDKLHTQREITSNINKEGVKFGEAIIELITPTRATVNKPSMPKLIRKPNGELGLRTCEKKSAKRSVEAAQKNGFVSTTTTTKLTSSARAGGMHREEFHMRQLKRRGAEKGGDAGGSEMVVRGSPE